MKDKISLLAADPYYDGMFGSSIEELHDDMVKRALPRGVPDTIRRSYDALRNAYVYSYFSYDLITLAAAQTFPCLELALRVRIGHQFEGRLDKKGKPRPPPMLAELLEAAKAQGMLTADLSGLNDLRKIFAHGSDAVLSPQLFLVKFDIVSGMIAELFR